MSSTANAILNIWTRNIDDEDSWELQLTTSNEQSALAAVERLGKGKVIATIYELGRFTVNGVEKSDQVMFWWSDNYSEELGGTPDGRGYGLPEDGDDWVDYEPVIGTAVATTRSRSGLHNEPPVKYRMIDCSDCGRRLPQNEAHPFSEELEVGRTSASYRVSVSSSHRTASHNNWSNSSRKGVLRSSGRHYYKKVNKLLCEDCYKSKMEEQMLKETEDAEFISFLFKSVAILIFIVFCIFCAFYIIHR